MEEKLLGLAVLANTAIGLCAHTMSTMVRRGVAAPEDVEQWADAITSHLDQPRTDLERRVYAQIGAVLEANLSPLLADMRQYARANWKDPEAKG